MSGIANDVAVQLLAELESVSSGIPNTARAFGAALIEKGSIVSLAGFSGATFAAPQAIDEHLRSVGKTRPAPFVVLTNDPYAGGISLNHLFLLARPAEGDFALVAALLLDDFGAMREDVFRHRREIFHEGLRLPLLQIDWDGTERKVLLDTVRANVRHADSVYALIERATSTLLAACQDLRTAPFRPSGLIHRALLPEGRGGASAPVGKGSHAVVHAELHASTHMCEVALSINGDEERSFCPDAAMHSAVGLALADAWSLPVLEALKRVRISRTGNVIATFPAAIGHSFAATADACYCAVFEAARGLGTTPFVSPRQQEAFAHLVSRAPT